MKNNGKLDGEGKDKPAEPAAAKPEPKKETPLSDVLPDSPGVVRAQDRAGITTLEQLKSKPDDELIRLPGIQGTRLKLIKAAIKHYRSGGTK
jgi:hypothetical protein